MKEELAESELFTEDISAGVAISVITALPLVEGSHSEDNV